MYLSGSFGSLAVQTGKNYPTTKATYQQSQQPLPTKQTFFSTFNYPQSIKTTPAIYSTSTPKLQAAQNQLFYSPTFNDLANVPTPRTKPIAPTKIDPNAGKKGGFKPSPHDHFPKQQADFNKITTYNPQATPITQVTSAPNQYYSYNFNIPNTQQLNYNQQTGNIDYSQQQQQQYYDNIGLNQQLNQQYIHAPGASSLFGAVNSVSYQPAYEVTDKEADDVTHASTGGWLPDTYETNQKVTEETISKPEHSNALFTNPTTVIPEPPEEYSIVTEPEKPYENGFNYENQYDTQNRRPLGDDFEPIGQHKLKDYYYKVSTPPARRTKKPPKQIPQEGTTEAIVVSEEPIEALPTLSPNQHFKRPSVSEPVEEGKIRKRNKLRRRRPIGSRIKDDSTTAKIFTTTTETPQTTEEIHTIRPRIRPVKSRTESFLTTVSPTTDLTTSALPTISPTMPTVMKKKLSHQRYISTTTGKAETTTHTNRESDHSKESPIMKIANRPQTKHSYEYKSEVPDYSHKQDEKDTPTSDIAVSLSDSYKNNPDILKDFSFHRDVRPVELTTVAHENTEAVSTTTTTTTTVRPETTRNIGKIQRPKLKLKHDRPKFSVKDYRNRLSSTTSSTENPEETPRPRPQRKNPYAEINTDVETTTERKRFTPKEPRHKLNRTENNEQEIHLRLHNRQKTTTDAAESTTKISARIRNGQRKPKPTEETIETSSTIAGKRPLRKKIKDSETGESVQDVSINETTLADKIDITSERTRSESAIMKIADKKHQDHVERLFEQSKRVSDLTLAASKDYNTPGMFKTVSSNSRRIPNYFTIATDDPILPIEAFFPQLNQKKEP